LSSARKSLWNTKTTEPEPDPVPDRAAATPAILFAVILFQGFRISDTGNEGIAPLPAGDASVSAEIRKGEIL
jgi:hypothetical protein